MATLYKIIDRTVEWLSFVGPGSWSNGDMPPLGNISIRTVDGGSSGNWTRLTQNQPYLLMTLKTIFQSPLV